MKKTVSVILCLITCFLIFTLCTPVTLAASYNGTCSGSISWSLDTSDGVLTISGDGDMDDLTMSSTPGWDRYQNYIKSVVFENGVTSVGAYTFYNGGKGYKYKKLTSVDLGEVEIIGQYAFRGCAFIDTITNTDNVFMIDDYAFLGCSSLTAFPFTSVTTINNGAFSCSGLTAISFQSNLKKIGAAAFEKCSSALSITTPASLTTIGDRAFADCTAVTDVTFNSKSLTSVGTSVFEGTGTDSGAVLTIANNVGTIPANMFSYFTGLTTVLGGNGIAIINEEAFAHTNITAFHIGPSVSSISETAFNDTMSLEAFTVDAENEKFTTDSAGVLIETPEIGQPLILRYPGGKTDISYTVPSNITSIAADAFRESRYLRTFTAGSSIAKIPNECFMNSPSLTTVSLASSVKTINDYAFANCKSLSSINMENITTINAYAFTQCDALPSLSTKASLAMFAFYDCDGITSVTITRGSATTINKYAFYGCDALKSVSIASNITTISDGAFFRCPELETLTLSEGLKTVSKYAFLDCPKLLSVRVPSTVTSIGTVAFGYKDYQNSSAKAVPGFKLYGYAGTIAQSYAANGNLDFEIVTDSASETVITDSDVPETVVSGGIASWLAEISQLPVISWLISIFSKIYRFFAGLIK